MKRIFTFSTLCLLLLAATEKLSAQTNELIPAGSYIINMGVVPQTTANALKPYGLVYALTKDARVPVKWSINPSKSAGGADFTYNGTDFKGGPFIVTEDYRDATVDSVITAWEALGVVGVTTTSDITVPIQTTINFVVRWTLDLDNGNIAQGYLDDAGIPSTAYDWTLPANLACCNDVFVMPHADPIWATHANLLNWNDDYANGGCQGAIWAACHAVSALENLYNPADTTQQMNFLSEIERPGTWIGDYADNSLVLWGDHSDGTIPYSYAYPAEPPMQFMGILDGATTNGSERIFIPHTQWSSHAKISTWDPDHPQLGGSKVAAAVVFGQAFGDPDRGKVMYEGGHNHGGSDPENIAAQRAMLNFSFWAASDKSIQVNAEVQIDSVIMQGVPAQASVAASGGSGDFTYTWSSSCAATFSNPDSSVTDYIATFPGTCEITCIITDACGRLSYTRSIVEVVPNPCQPVEGADYVDGNVFYDSDWDAVKDSLEANFELETTINVYVDTDGNGTLNGGEGTVYTSMTTTNGFYSFELTPPQGASQLTNTSVAASANDALEAINGTPNTGGSKLEFTSAKPYNGIRFTSVNVPRGAQIQNAYIQMTGSDNRGAPCTLEISVQDAVNPNAFNTSTYNISNRYDATNTVAWNTQTVYKDIIFYTPDISPLIQSVVDQLNWNSGQSIVILIKWVSGDERKARSFDGGVAPKLVVQYSPLDYPISYVLKVDPASLPKGGGVTTANNEIGITYTGSYQAYCNTDFGVIVNRALAVDDANVTVAEIPVSGDVMRNDFDPEGHNLTFESFLNQDGSGNPITTGATLAGTDTSGAPVANAGSIVFDGTGYTFTPQAGFAGEVVVDYAMYDDGTPVVYDTASLTIKVSISSNPGITTDNSVLIMDDYSRSFGGTMTGNLLANDMDPEWDNLTMQSFMYDSDADGEPDASTTSFGQAFNISGLDPYRRPVPNAGSFTLNSDGSFSFVAAAGFYGVAVIEYTVCDDYAASMGCSSARLRIEVVEDKDPLTNDPPYAGDDYASTMINTPVTGNWLANDRDYNGDNIKVNGTAISIDPLNPGAGATIGSYVTEQGGTLVMYDDGTFEYTPPSNYKGADKLNYTIADDVASPLSDPAAIYLFVAPMYFDYGDLPEIYPEVGHLVAEIGNGIYIPSKAQSFWLGAIVDAEPNAIKSAEADGDNSSEVDDEEGLIIPEYNKWFAQNNIANFKVVVNGSEAGMEVFFGLWIDWEFDGVFEDFYSGSGTISSNPNGRAVQPDTVLVQVTVPSSVSAEIVGFRLRAFSSMPDNTKFSGNYRNGEAEDYYMRNSTFLPVELTTFEAVASEDKALLTWQTASEVNNDYFLLQRSNNAVHWQDIAMIEGQGSTTEVTNYGYLDEQLQAGSYYYRLKQVDYDGTTDYSEVRFVQIYGRAMAHQRSLNIFPVPASINGVINIEGLANNGAGTEIRLTSMNGSINKVIVLNGNNSVNLAGSNFDPGMYIMEISEPAQPVQSKIIVMYE